MIRAYIQLFGFDGLAGLAESMCPSQRYNHSFALLVLGGSLGALAEHYIGLKSVTIIAFMVMLGAELGSGMYASFIRKRRFTSIKFFRFMVKLTLWMICLFIVHSFAQEYTAEGWLAANFFTWLKSALIVYVAAEYLISILENIAVISGKSTSRLSTAIKSKIDWLLNNQNNPQDENKNYPTTTENNTAANGEEETDH